MKTFKLHLSPYGTFEHPEGLQSISSADAQRCIRKTRTWRFRLGLKKIPVYLGHPDDPLFKSEHSDPRIYGYVRWVLCKTEHQTAYHPERLLSLGLTQHPNLPVQPIVFDALPKKSLGLRALLRFLTKRQVSSKTSHTKTGGVRSDGALHKGFATFIKRIRQAFVKKTKQTAPTVGTHSPAPLPTSDEDLFSGQRTPLSSDLHGAQTRKEKRRILQFGQAVRERMKATGESYPEAWNVLLHQTPSAFANNRPNTTVGEHSEPPTACPKRNNFVPRSLKPMTVTE